MKSRRFWLKVSSVYTPNSVTDLDAYRAMLDRDRKLGYSVSRGRWVPNGAGIASPFFDANGICAGAVTRSCPGDRLDRFPIVEVGAAIFDAGRQLSRRLGCVGTWGPADET
jgi:DNA-binding IclR family transcriptional regulator